MVILEATAIGVGGYAAYRGGEKATHVGKQKVEDVKRGMRRREENKEFATKAKERSARLSSIKDRINNRGTASATKTSSERDPKQDIEKIAQQDRLSSIKDRMKKTHAKEDKKKTLFGRMKSAAKQTSKRAKNLK